MPDTKNTNSKKNAPVGKDISKAKIASQAMPEQEKVETPQTPSGIETEKGFLGEVAENIGESAKTVGEKTTELSDLIVDKLKKGWSQAYAAGAKVVDELSQTAQEYTDKYKAESKIRKLKGEKDTLLTLLGRSIFNHHLAGGKFTESFFNKKAPMDQFNQIEILDKKIIKIGKQLDKGKK